MSSILKTSLGVAGGLQLFKMFTSFAETVSECKAIYDKNLNGEPRLSNATPSSVDNKQLKEDAVNALVNLGYKTRDSQKRVTTAINEGRCKTVQDIIKFVLTNSSNK